MSEFPLTIKIVQVRDEISRASAQEIEQRLTSFDSWEKYYKEQGMPQPGYTLMDIITLQAIGERIEVLNTNGQYDHLIDVSPGI